MSVDRGYATGRKGKGAGGKKPARTKCPSCTKKGVGQWKASEFGVHCECQYCRNTWTKESWAIEQGAKHNG